MLSSLSGADGFAILDEERDVIRPGDAIDFIPLL
jgi:molybdopterin biosynthesis enzyme